MRSDDKIETPEFSMSTCKLTAMVKPGPANFISGRFVTRMIVNENGEPEAIAIQAGPKSNRDVTALLSMLWNWRFAPTRGRTKPAFCTAYVGVTIGKNR
jgi:hypothetical protein